MAFFQRIPVMALALTAASFGGAAADAQVVATAEGQQALLASADPKLAANKKLVYDMYRHIVQGGHADMVAILHAGVHPA